MTKAGEKLIAAAKEAVKVAQCDHAWKSQKRVGRFDVCECSKCGGTFYFPVDRHCANR